jgi:hypothetical protein
VHFKHEGHLVANDKPTRRNWEMQRQDAEFERNRAQIEAQIAWYKRYVEKFQAAQERERQDEERIRQEAADKIKADRQAELDQIVATVKPVLAELVAGAAAKVTLKEFLFGHKGKGIRGAVEDCPRLSPDEEYSHWAVRLLPLATSAGFKTSERTIAEYLSRRYGQRKMTLATKTQRRCVTPPTTKTPIKT